MRPRFIHPRLALAGFVSVAALLMVELGSRALLWMNTPPGMKFDEEAIYSFEPFSKPYLGMEPVNNIGCIGDDIGPRVSGEFRVVLLGGSTSFSRVYVDVVRQHLTTHLKASKVTVVSVGKPRYTSHTNRVMVERLLPELSPDVVVLYLGINDNIYNTFPWLRNAPDVGYFDWRSRTSIFFRLLKYHVVDKRLRSTPGFSADGLRSPEILRGNVQAIIRIAELNNVRVVLSTFAVALPSNDPKLVERINSQEPVMEHFWGRVESTLLGVAAHNQVMKELAATHALPLAPAADVIPKDGKHFGDICHLTTQGNRLLGETIAEGILPPVNVADRR